MESAVSQQKEHYGIDTVNVISAPLSVSDHITIERKRFEERLVAEQIEEASFLYEQRLNMLDTKPFGWRHIRNNENRLSSR